MNGYYDAFRIRIHATTAYAQAHEWAHLEQHRRRTIAWRAHELAGGIPLVAFATAMVLEIGAAVSGLAELQSCGILELGDVLEAFAGLLSYRRALFWL